MKIPQTKRYSIYKKLVLQNKQSKKLNFEVDGREHYVYRITDYTRIEKEHYYGSHTPPKGKKYNNLIEEFWTYKTSSKYNVLNENIKENYKVKIIKVFDNPSDKMIYEAFLHQYFDVKQHNSFWNESNQTAFGFDTTGKLSWNKNIFGKMSHVYGRIVSDSQKHKNSLKHTGKIVSSETKKKLSIANKGKKHSEETKIKMSKSQIGRVHSEETKIKMSKSQRGLKTSSETILKISGCLNHQFRGYYSFNDVKFVNATKLAEHLNVSSSFITRIFKKLDTPIKTASYTQNSLLQKYEKEFVVGKTWKEFGFEKII